MVLEADPREVLLGPPVDESPLNEVGMEYTSVVSRGGRSPGLAVPQPATFVHAPLVVVVVVMPVTSQPVAVE